MRFDVSKTTLQDAIAIVSKATASSSTLPILTGILLKAEEGELTLQATDLDVSLRHTVAANVREPGSTVVSGKILANLVKTLRGSTVSFDSDHNSIQVKCGNSRFNLNTLNPVDFPEFPQIDPEKSVALPVDTLADMVNRVYKMTSKDLSHPILGGIYLTVDENLVRLVATDSYRLAVCDTNVETSTLTESFQVIVSGNAFHEALSTFPSTTDDGSAAEVVLGATDSQVSFRCGNTLYVSRCIEGNFPDYRQLLPSSCTTSLTPQLGELQDALKCVSVMTTQNPRVRFDVDVDGARVTLSAVNADMGDAVEVLEDIEVEGQNVSIGLNHRYVSDCLAALGDRETVSIELLGEMQPAIFKSYGKPNYLQLIMPTRL